MPTAKRWKTRSRKDKQRLLPFRSKRQQLQASAQPSAACALTRATEAAPSATRKPRQSLNGQSRKRRTMRCQNLERSGAYRGNSRGSNNCDAR